MQVILLSWLNVCFKKSDKKKCISQSTDYAPKYCLLL